MATKKSKYLRSPTFGENLAISLSRLMGNKNAYAQAQAQAKKEYEQEKAQTQSVQPDMNAQPNVLTQEKAFPSSPKITYNQDKTMSYSHDSMNKNLTAEETKQYSHFMKMRADLGEEKSREYPEKTQWQVFLEKQGKFLSPNVRELIDYSSVQSAMTGESMRKIPSGISSQDQLDLYNKIKDQEAIDKRAELEAEAAKYQRPVEPFKGTAKNPLLAAGFMASGALGSAGLITGGQAVLGAAGIGTGAAGAAGLSALALPAAIAAAGAFLAYKSKTRNQDIRSAKQQSTSSQQNIQRLISMANSGQFTEGQILQAMEKERRDVYAAQAFLMKRSYIDVAFWVDEGKDELIKIEEFNAMYPFYREQIMQSLMNPNPALFNSSLFLDSEVAQ